MLRLMVGMSFWLRDDGLGRVLVVDPVRLGKRRGFALLPPAPDVAGDREEALGVLRRVRGRGAVLDQQPHGGGQEGLADGPGDLVLVHGQKVSEPEEVKRERWFTV